MKTFENFLGELLKPPFQQDGVFGTLQLLEKENARTSAARIAISKNQRTANRLMLPGCGAPSCFAFDPVDLPDANIARLPSFSEEF